MKTKLIYYFLIFVFSIIQKNVLSQCDCSELLKYGLYNHFSTVNKVANYSSLKSDISNMMSKGKTVGANGQAQYGLYGGQFNYSQTEQMNILATSATIDINSSNQILETSSSVISDEMISAYKECIKLQKSSGLNIKADLPSDGLSNVISFDIKYIRPELVEKTPILKSITIEPKGSYTVNDSTLYKIIQNKGVLAASTYYSLTCIRNIASAPYKLKGTDDVLIYAESSLIKIETDMGNYSVRIPCLFAKTQVSLMVGTIVTSMLEPEDFYRVNGLDWVLADGRKAPYGCAYCSLVNDTVPDLRGLFLRGKNYGRNDGKQNPDGDLKLGTYQKAGTYLDNTYRSLFDTYCAGKLRADEISFGKTMGVRSKLGENETRPQNITINYYIKVN